MRPEDAIRIRHMIEAAEAAEPSVYGSATKKLRRFRARRTKPSQ
jgi:hypothetical protein